MKVIIKEREYDYVSDYPDGWRFFSSDYFKFPVEIGSNKCFIKRFEKKNPEQISGWQLLLSLKSKHESNLPRIYDIIGAKEYGKNVYYIFYEFVEGDTLDNLISKNIEINLSRLTEDLFNALQSLLSKDYWFADFCEKNIFYEKKGRFLLVDLDSAQPLSEVPKNDMFGNKDYWVLVFNFYKKILGQKNFNLSDINGISLNYLQVVFLIMRLKIFYSNREKEYHSHELFDSLPAILNYRYTSFKKIINKVLQNGNTPLHSDDISDIKVLIEEKIINEESSNVNSAAADLIESQITNQTETVRSAPVINEFNVSDYTEKNGDDYLIESGKAFALNWNVKNALVMELYKNGEFYQKLNTEKKSIPLKETYDGKEKKIKYTLQVSNGFSSTSRSLMITVMDITRDDSIIDIYQGPVINEFRAGNYVEKKGDVYVAESGKTFTLNWNVKNALKIELYKNGNSFKVFSSGEKSIELKEVYDGKEKEIIYSLEASNNSIEIQNKSLTIKIIPSAQGPIINEFKVSNYAEKEGEAYVVESGKAFTLNWDVRNAVYIELQKNGQPFKKISSSEKNIEITEVAYDGKEMEINYTLQASNDSLKIKSNPLTILVREAIPVRPIVNQFKVNKHVLRNGGYFTLNWDVQNTTTVELYKNDELYKKFSKGEKSIKLKENYDGREKKIKYTLRALNVSAETKSNPVIIFVKPPASLWKILTAVLAVFVLLFALFYIFHPFSTSSKAIVYPSKFIKITEGDTITVFGKNLPVKAGSLKIKFDNDSAQIIQQTKDSIKVLVPQKKNTKKEVTITAHLNKTDFVVAEHVLYQNITPTVDLAVVYPFKKNEIIESETITILGKNLPLNIGSVQVDFNNEKGKIILQEKDSIKVQVPVLASSSESIKIITYLNGIPFTVAENVHYKKSNTLAPLVYPFRKREIFENDTITISGENLPQNAVLVTFNNIRGTIIKKTKENIRVIVPLLTEAVVDIIVYVNGNGFKVASSIPYQRKKVAIVYPFNFTKVTDGDIITIAGKNLPQSEKEGILEVMFNNVKSKINQQTKDYVSIQVPSLGNNTEEVDIKVSLNGSVLRADHMVYQKKGKDNKRPEKVNLRDLVEISSNKYKKDFLGGIHNLAVTVYNNSGYNIVKLVVDVSYVRRNGKEYKHVELSFNDVKPNSSATLEAPKSTRGVDVKLNIKSVSSKEFGEQ